MGSRRRADRRAALLTLVAAALVAATLPMPVPAQGPDQSVDVEAEVRSDGAHVNVTADGTMNGTVVVSHEDPLVGETVDRVVPVNVSAGVRTHVAIRDLRLEGNLTVRLFDEEIGVDPGNRTDEVLDRVRNLTPIEETVVPVDIEASEGRSVLVGHDPIDVEGSFDRPTLWIGPDGTVAFLYTNVQGPDDEQNRLRVRASHDDGHDFGDPLGVTGTAYNRSIDASAGFVDEGRFAVVHRGQNLTGQTSYERSPWTMTVLDLEAGRVLSRTRMTEGRFDVDWSNRVTVVPADDGAIAFIDGGVVERDEAGDRVQEWNAGDGHLVLDLEAEGGVADVRKIEAPTGWEVSEIDDVHAAANGDGVVAIASPARGRWEPGQEDDPTWRPWIASSTDGGETFTFNRLVNETIPTDHDAFLDDVEVGPDGTVHTIWQSRNVSKTGSAAREEHGWYVQVAADRTVRSTSLDDALPSDGSTDGRLDHRQGQVVASEDRVWLAWTTDLPAADDEDAAFSEVRHALWTAESVDGGRTFDAPYRVKVLYEPWGAGEDSRPRWRRSDVEYVGFRHQLGMFPDGRPMLIGGCCDDETAMMQLFDPIPSPETGTTVVVHASLQDLPGGDGEGSGGAGSSDETTRRGPSTPHPGMVGVAAAIVAAILLRRRR